MSQRKERGGKKKSSDEVVVSHDQTSANNPHSRQWSFGSTTSSHRSNSPNPGSAIASLVLASSSSPFRQEETSSSPSNRVQHQVLLWNQKHSTEEGERRMSQDQERKSLGGTFSASSLSSEKERSEKEKIEKGNRKEVASERERKNNNKESQEEIRRVSDANISSFSPSSSPHHQKLGSRSESLTTSRVSSTAHSEGRGSEEKIHTEEESEEKERGKEELSGNKQDISRAEILSLDSTHSSTVTTVSSSSSSSSARGTLSSPSLVSGGDNSSNYKDSSLEVISDRSGSTVGESTQRDTGREEERKGREEERKGREEERSNKEKEVARIGINKAGNEKNEMKNPFKSKNRSESQMNEVGTVGQALAGVLTGGSGSGSVTSMDTLDPLAAVASGNSGGNPSAINPILAREARTRSFLVGNLGCHVSDSFFSPSLSSFFSLLLSFLLFLLSPSFFPSLPFFLAFSVFVLS